MKANLEFGRPINNNIPWRVFIVLHGLLLFSSSVYSVTNNTRETKASSPLTLSITKTHVVMDNGLITLTLTNPTGGMAEIRYQGIDNVLENDFKETNRGYWDLVWNKPGKYNNGRSELLPGTQFRVIISDENQIEVSFTKSYNPKDYSSLPLNVDKRYVMLRGQSGFYTYAIYEHLQGWPDVDLGQARIAIKLRRSLFKFMAISDDIQREMPSDNDRSKGKILDYKEAILLTNPSKRTMKGEVDDKYQYALENKDIKVHGWICPKPHVGFWIITGSNEFRSGGPIRQDLTSHVGPTALSMFFSGHYAGDNYGVNLRNGEAWKKVFGPVFIYLNSDLGTDPKPLWNDAKRQMVVESSSWPYDFVKSEDYPTASQRGTVIGRLLIRDRYLSNKLIPAKYAYIGLASPGADGYWQEDAKGYQFWTQTDENGYFQISAVRSGTYNLYGWVPGILGDYRNKVDIIIRPGEKTSLGELEFDPPRNGPTLWEIGIPDRKAAEFFIPDPAPHLKNYALLNQPEKFRQYGLWDRYTDLFPLQDLVFTIGKSDYTKDWFFAHVSRKVRDKVYAQTTWRISFPMDNVNPAGTYTLRIAIAATNLEKIDVLINNPNGRPMFTTDGSVRDNAIARHGSHGLYTLSSFEFQGSELVKGENNLYLRQTRKGDKFNGVMYDYIRLEGPSL